jgi:HKD family nuclease
MLLNNHEFNMRVNEERRKDLMREAEVERLLKAGRPVTPQRQLRLPRHLIGALVLVGLKA